MPEDKIEIENVNTPGRTERVDRAKYLAIRSALLAVLPSAAPGLKVADAKEPLLPYFRMTSTVSRATSSEFGCASLKQKHSMTTPVQRICCKSTRQKSRPSNAWSVGRPLKSSF